MSILERQSTTTGLLGINAILLLILVVQNASRGNPSPPSPPMQTQAPFAGHPPIDNQGAPPAQGGTMPMQGDNFDPTSMIMAALICPTDSTTTLDSPNCSGKGVEERRSTVHEFFQKEASIRGVFDGLVKKYGEGALTQQARDIRKARRQGAQ